ncbi:MAG: MOSC N-terminal beta barrel domain-containing protein [Steroidobacteraceae bacterium]
MSTDVRIESLHAYPLKSARGLLLDESVLSATGLRDDRRWLLITPAGRFLTQRENPRLALLQVAVEGDALRLWAADLAPLRADIAAGAAARRVQVWDDECSAFDAGDACATALSHWLGRPCRLVRFDPDLPRPGSRKWSGDIEALNMFSDGYPVLVIGRASLQDLNSRLSQPLGMERFRPNLVISGLAPYEEDRLHELRSAAGITLRIVKPCTRCVITCTDQESGRVTGDEPLRTLRGYRYDAALRGVCFGQNAVIVSGVGQRLRRGETLQASWRA